MSTRSRERLLLLLFLLFAFALRMWDLGRNSFWYDEILQFQAVTGSVTDFYNALIVHAAMPLDYLIQRAVLFLGTNELLLRFPAAAFSTLAVAVIYKLGRAMFGQATGLIAAAFLAVSSFAVFYAHEARPYSLYMLLVLTAFFWLYRALQTNKLTHWFYFGLSLAGATLTHLFALFVILALVLFLLSGLAVRAIAPRRAQLFSRITRTAIGGGVLVALLFLAALWLTPNARFVWGSSLRFFSFLFAPQFLPPALWYGLAPGETPPLLTFDFFYTRILENFSGGGTFATATFVGLGLVGLVSFRAKPWETFLLALWAILSATLIVLFLGSRGTLFAARYLIASLPAWILLCAVGAHTIATLLSRLTLNNTWVRRVAMFAIALVFVLVSLERTAAIVAFPKEDWRAAGQMLDANVQPGDAVITPGGTNVVYFYARKAGPYEKRAETETQIAEVANQAERLWFVMNRYVYDPGGEIQAWLDGHGAIALRADSGITLYYWRLGADETQLLQEAKVLQLPASPFAYASLAEQFARNGDAQTAEHYFARALTYSKSNDQAAMVNLTWGEAARRAGELDRAAEKYRSALASNARLGTAWIGLGRVYLKQNQLSAAQDALTRALALEPNSYPALLFLAEAYERSGQDATAQQYYARAAEIIPELTTPP